MSSPPLSPVPPALLADRDVACTTEGGQNHTSPVHRKKSRSEPINYIPLCHHFIISRIFEKIIEEQLVSFLEENHLQSQKQFGFRNSNSTSDFLLLLSKYWHNALNDGHNSLVTALDIARVF